MRINYKSYKTLNDYISDIYIYIFIYNNTKRILPMVLESRFLIHCNMLGGKT